MTPVPAEPLLQLAQPALPRPALQGTHHPTPTPGLQEREGEGDLDPTLHPASSQGTQPESPTASDPDEGSGGSSASEDGSESDGEGEAGSNGRASDSGSSSDDESSGSSESGSEEASDNEGTQQDGSDNEDEGSGSEMEGSDAGGGSSPSKSDHAESPPKASPPAKKGPEVNLNTSQTLSLPDLDSKDSEEERKTNWCRDARLLEKDFGKWWDQKISEGLRHWDEHDKITCDHADPCKEAKSPNQLGLPLDYMMSHGVFKPKKTSEYDLKWGSLETYQSFPCPVHLQPVSK